MPDATTTTSAAAPKSASSVFVARLVSTVILWGLIGTALAFQVDWPLLVLATVFGLLGTWEYGGLQRSDPGSKPFTQWMLVLSVGYWTAVARAGLASRGIVKFPGDESIPLWIDALSLLLMTGGAFFLTLFRSLEGEVTLRRIVNSVFGFVYTTLALGYLVRILFLPGTNFGAHLMLFVIAAVKFGDMGAYTLGSWIGRHKMIPHISPAKSWEGAAGAVLGSCIAAAVMMIFDGSRLVPLTWTSAIVLAVVLCVVGAVGDLAESILKRCHGVKDSGQTLPGIGGILDLTDSLLFAAPVAYFYFRFLA